MYRIISIDLDGTLLSSKHKITEYTKQVIRDLAAKQFHFILASGRHHTDIMKIKNILKIKSFIIASNGAKIYDLNNKIIFNDYIESNIASNLCRMRYADSDIITQIYQDNQWYINNNKIDNKFCPNLSFLRYKYFHPNQLKYNNISKIFFTSGNFTKLQILEKKIINDWSEKVNTTFSVPGCLEVVSGKSSKGYGLRLISNLLGVSLNDCFSFGDGMNDYDMLSISGKSYIMKNADLRLKNALPYSKIIENNDNHGVAQCLDEIFIKNNDN